MISTLFGQIRNPVGLLFTLMLLSGCGWQLAGSHPLPSALKVVYLSEDISQDLSNALHQHLKLQGALLVTSPDNALSQLRPGQFSIERRTLTVDSNGRIAEYELHGFASLSVLRAGYADPIEVSASAWVRLNNDTARVLATESNAASQTRLLVQELARKLINRLANTTGHLE